MLEIANRLQAEELADKCLIINQVHDSIILDCLDDKKIIDKACSICYTTFNDLPVLIKRWFGIDWITPLTGECKYGNNWGKMTIWEP